MKKPPPIQGLVTNALNRFTEVWIKWFQDVDDRLDAAETNIDELNSVHGWAYYDDSQYTSGSPLSVPVGRTQLTINALGASNNTTYLPAGQSWWSGNKITPGGVGDSYVLRLDFTATAGSPADKFNLELEIAPGNLVVSQTFEMNKGAGTDHIFNVAIPIFTLNTFLANGGKFYLNASNAFTVYNIGLFISRLYKA